MYCYFAQFYPEENGYSVFFPDFPGCNTCGDTLDEAMCMAMEALTLNIETALEDGETLPAPSDYETAKAKALDWYQSLGLEPKADALYLLVPAEPRMESFTRLNISLHPRLLAQIDRQAKAQGMTRSGFLAQAARNYLAGAAF